MTDESILDALRRLIKEDGMDVDAASDKVLGFVSRAKLAEFVRPVVLAEARRVARQVARSIEDAAFSHPPTNGRTSPADLSSGGGEPRLSTGEARQALVATRFVLPDGQWVTWGQATAEDHRARAGWLRGLASTITTGAQRHEHAADLIDSHDATCLDDIDAWADLLNEAA